MPNLSSEVSALRFPGKLTAGPYQAEQVLDAGGLQDSLALRQQIFRGGRGTDRDRFDDLCRHILIRDRRDGRAVAGFRFRMLRADQVASTYTAQFYDLSALSACPGPLAELGRLALEPAHRGPDCQRLVLAALTRLVLAERVRVIFGCTSFPGADASRHAPALAWLNKHHPALQSVPSLCPVAATSADQPDGRGVPSLLRSYLAMGGRVGAEPASDPDLDTLHVFTMLDVAQMPEARARALIRLLRQAARSGAASADIRTA